MGWLAITDLHLPGETLSLSSGYRSAMLDGDGMLASGALVLEAEFVAMARMPQRLLRYERTEGWLRRLSLTLTSEGVLTLEHRQGDAVSRAQVSIAVPPRETRLRITYTWDAPGRRAILTVENLDQELLHQAECADPLPLPLADAHALALNGACVRAGPETKYLALSDRLEPVGLGAGFVHGTPVETECGPQRIERLRLGDRLVTAGGMSQPVRWIVRREVPALGRFRPIRLRAPYFGLSRDILVASDHRVMVTGTEAEYLFGEDSVLVRAADLVDGRSVRREAAREDTIWHYHVLLDTHACINTAGLWSESLFVGAMARMPEMIATTALAEMPAQAIPRHTRFARPILSGMEAKSLVTALSA